MSRFPVAAFGALVAATIAAFFVTQHLKVSTPLIAGSPAPFPNAINPLHGNVCRGVNHRRTMISFYLLHRADDVDVYVVDQSGEIVRTVALGRHMRRGVRAPDGVFFWNGRQDDGSVAPDGNYYFRVALIHQGRTVLAPFSAEPITVMTVPPRPVITSVEPSLIPQKGFSVAIRYRGSENRSGTVLIYRTDLPGTPRLVKVFHTQWRGNQTIWDGTIDGRPPQQGTYLVGFEATDRACNTGRFPARWPPPPGSTPHSGVTVRYLSAEPPLHPVPSGSRAVVYVDARQQRYRWTLRHAGTSERVIASGASRRFDLPVRVPPRVAGLYEVAIRSGTHRTAVPIVVSAPASPRPPRVLVVLPALTWQGQNPVDDDGDGIPNTLDNGGPIELHRPLANGLPSGFADEAAFLSYLAKGHLRYDLTTDLGLIDGSGPGLSGRTGVVLAGSERWLPGSLGSALRAYVEHGGRVLSLGIDSLRRGVTLAGGEASDPTSARSTDVLGARPGAIVTHNGDLITVLKDDLGIFSGTSGALRGYRAYEPFASVAPPAQESSEAGTSTGAPSIVGYQLGRGIVVDIGLPGFGSSLARNIDAQELVSRLWTVLGG